MSANVQLIWKKIEHLRRMRSYLNYSLEQTLLLIPITDWHQLTPAQHESLAVAQAAPELYTWFDRTISFCESSYPNANP